MSRHDACRACEGPVGFDGGSLPVDNNGDIVANEFKGEWGGVPACRRCIAIHAAGGPKVLDTYLEVSEDLRRDLSTARAHLQMIRGKCYEALAEIGEGR